MPRRNKNEGLNFEIHEDSMTRMDEESDTKDFVTSADSGDPRLGKGDEIEHTGSTMAAPSTLVGEHSDKNSGDRAKRERELTVDSMLEELEGRKSIVSTEVDTESSFSRRDSAISGATQDDDFLGQKSIMAGEGDPEASDYSRRQSAASRETYDSHTESSFSRRESTLSAGTHDGGTEGSISRRESAMSAASRDDAMESSLSRRESTVSGVTYDVETESRRESTLSSATYESSRRASGQTDHGDEPTLKHEIQDDPNDMSLAEGDGHAQPSESRRDSIVSDATPGFRRRGSGRTEAMIQAAARDIVDQINHGRPRGSFHNGTVTEDQDYVPETRHTSARQSESHESVADQGDIRESIEQDDPAPPTEEAAYSSSHNENEDDVFSDHSPRSSVGSVSEPDQRKMDDSVTQRTYSPRISDFSHYEDQDDEVFVPTVRGTPRPPFRSPSSVKAMQMSSPPPSELGSSRSSRKTPLPTVSRLGSPSAQYSPKKTPPRFKRNTPPLVLLHVTLLPLRWPWGDVLDSCQAHELSQGGKSLQDAWRQLQDRLGDTVCERGILLPHPQNDFEVLEERLLEALDLPLRRRARILECGHYLGPSNETTLAEEMDSEDECQDDEGRSYRSSLGRKTHWCGMCQSEIGYESLGAGKIFRVKVYASNGLVKAGAWEACWKEMERVDVELEPIVEPGIHGELVRLDAEQQSAMELQHQNEELIKGGPDEEPEESYMEQEATKVHHISSSPPPEIRVTSSPPVPIDEDRRRRDEERLREIYGQTPPGHTQDGTAEPPTSDYAFHQTPPSPSAEAFARREERRQAHKNESLPDLLLEALRVMMHDRKNAIIAIMSILVLMLALRGGSPSSDKDDRATFQAAAGDQEAAAVAVEAAATRETVESTTPAVEAVASSLAAPEEASPSSENMDPFLTQLPSSGAEGHPSVLNEPDTSETERIVRVFETITETAMETATVTETQTHDAQETDDVAQQSEEPVESTVMDVTEDEAGVDAEPEAGELHAEEPGVEEEVSEAQGAGEKDSEREA